MTNYPNAGNWIAELTTTQGSGELSLLGAIDGFGPFSLLEDGPVYYTIENGANKETGIGTLRGKILERTVPQSSIYQGKYLVNQTIPLNGQSYVFCSINAHQQTLLANALAKMDQIAARIPDISPLAKAIEDITNGDTTFDGVKTFVNAPIISKLGGMNTAATKQYVVDEIGKIPVTPPVGGGILDKQYATVLEMKSDGELKSGDYVSTVSYYGKLTPVGLTHGGASYRIISLDERRNELGDQSWNPDGYGDHLVVNGLVAILDTKVLWAGQLGLRAPVVDIPDAVAKNIDHADDFNDMYEYLDNYVNKYKSLVLHVESGFYAVNKTAWIPHGVLLCGGTDWGSPAKSVHIAPYKPKHGGNIDNYYPKANTPKLMDLYRPNGAPGGSGYAAIDPIMLQSNGGKIEFYYQFPQKTMYDDDKIYACFGSSDPDTWLRSSGDKQKWQLSIKFSDGTIWLSNELDFKSSEGKHKITTELGDVVWYMDGVEVARYTIPVGSTFTVDRFYNDASDGHVFVGQLRYLFVVGGDGWPEVNNFYSEGLKKVEIGTTPTDLVIQGDIGGHGITLKSFPVGQEWILDTEFAPNPRKGFMFIWNAKVTQDGGKTFVTPPFDPDFVPSEIDHFVPNKNIYIPDYAAGMSSIILHNYEDNEAEPINKDYLQDISGCMCFGSSVFMYCSGNRIATFAHRPEYETDNYYMDAWEVHGYDCNTPIENKYFQFDYNGVGDAVRFENCRFPVNHPNEQLPYGEYPNGVVKAIKMQNTIFSLGRWDLLSNGVSVGCAFNRLINGRVELHGVGSFQVNNCHMEFGQVYARDSDGSINDSYFSKISLVGTRDPEGDPNNPEGDRESFKDYPDIMVDTPLYPGGTRVVNLNNIHIHRGFNGAHLPNCKYDIIIAENAIVNFNDVYQGWNMSGNGPAMAAPTVGVIIHTDPKDYDTTKIIDLAGWDRWGQYLCKECTITRGKIEPKKIQRVIGGFSGIEEAFRLTTDYPGYWNNTQDNKRYYYNSQLILDPGDLTLSDTPFVPLGMTPFIGYVNDDPAQGRKSTEVSTYITAKTDTHSTWASLSIYPQIRTISDGVMRIYRGEQSGNYTHYVDIPSPSMASFDDIGDKLFGRPWKDNPSAPNMIPIREVKNQDVVEFFMVGGDGYARFPIGSRPEFEPDGYATVISRKELKVRSSIALNHGNVVSKNLVLFTDNRDYNRPGQGYIITITLGDDLPIDQTVEIFNDGMSINDSTLYVQVAGNLSTKQGSAPIKIPSAGYIKLARIEAIDGSKKWIVTSKV